MYIWCINDDSAKDYLKVGNAYHAEDTGQWYYRVRTNHGWKNFNKSRFETSSGKKEAKEMKYKQEFWMVMGDKATVTISYRHYSEADAITEAKRLAKKNPGQGFIVLKSITSFETTEITETRYDDVPF